jgi:hypothetical protein
VRHNFGVLPLVSLLFTTCPCKFKSGTDNSYEVLRFVELMTTETVINQSVNVRLLCFVFGLLDRNIINCKQH